MSERTVQSEIDLRDNISNTIDGMLLSMAVMEYDFEYHRFGNHITLTLQRRGRSVYGYVLGQTFHLKFARENLEEFILRNFD